MGLVTLAHLKSLTSVLTLEGCDRAGAQIIVLTGSDVRVGVHTLGQSVHKTLASSTAVVGSSQRAVQAKCNSKHVGYLVDVHWISL